LTVLHKYILSNTTEWKALNKYLLVSVNVRGTW